MEKPICLASFCWASSYVCLFLFFVLKRAFAMASGVALFVRSQFSKSTSKLEKIYIDEFGLRDGQRDKGGPSSFDLPPEQRPS